MKTSNLIWSIVIAAVIIFLIYKAYVNYQASGSIFRSSVIVVPSPSPDVVVVNGTTSQGTTSRFVATGGQQMDTH